MIILKVLLSVSLMSQICQADEICRPFLLHPSAVMSKPPIVGTSLPPKEALLAQLSKVSSPAMAHLYREWSNRQTAPDEDQRKTLACWLYYIKQDTDGDGLADWTATVDGKLSKVLLPLDKDIDGDGIENVLDPFPFEADAGNEPEKFPVPSHLRMDGPRSAIQSELYKKFGLLAVDLTDTHSFWLLQQLKFLLNEAFPPDFIHQSTGLKYLYATLDHDSEVNVAGYHHQAQAVTVGGEESYSYLPATDPVRINILFSLAHEIGHAFVLRRFSPDELRETAIRFGGWKNVLNAAEPQNMYNPCFFSPHPFKKFNIPVAANPWMFGALDLPSKYALDNVHEWVAETFAATVLNRLGRLGKIPADWHTFLPRNSPVWGWTNYANLSKALENRLEKKMAFTDHQVFIDF